MISYARAVWNCRWFWLSLARLDLRKRYRGSVLGLGWSLVHPLLTSFTLCLVFGAALGTEFRTFFPFLLCGLCFWSFFTASIDQGCGCLFWSETYIRQHRAPMGIYPLRVVLAAAFHLGAALVPLVIAVWALKGIGSLAAAASLLAALALLLVFGWSLATLCGFLNAYFPDAQQFAGAVLQILFYTTPVIYRPDILRERGLDWLLATSPPAVFLEAIRQPVLEAVPPSAEIFGAMAICTGVAFCLATLTLAWLERTVIFQL